MLTNSKTKLKMEVGQFYDHADGFVLPTKPIPMLSELILEKLPLTCMFEIHIITVNDERAGFFFVTRFSVLNRGGYLLTYLQNKDKANEVETLIRTEDLIVYHYPNRGTLAVSPMVGLDIQTIFEEQ